MIQPFSDRSTLPKRYTPISAIVNCDSLEIVYQRIRVILLLPQGRRRISEILRRLLPADSSE
jgi:hypothetical protein